MQKWVRKARDSQKRVHKAAGSQKGVREAKSLGNPGLDKLCDIGAADAIKTIQKIAYSRQKQNKRIFNFVLINRNKEKLQRPVKTRYSKATKEKKMRLEREHILAIEIGEPSFVSVAHAESLKQQRKLSHFSGSLYKISF